MKIRLNSYRHVYGGIFLWILAFVVVIAIVAYIYVKMVSAIKRIKPINPNWDEVYLEMYEEARRIAIAEGGDPDIPGLYQIPEVYEAGYGLIVRSQSLTPPGSNALAAAIAAEAGSESWSTNSADGETVEFIKMPQGSLLDWQMPPPDPSIPMMFYHRMVIVTNESAITED